VIGGLGAMRYWARELTQFTFVPALSFQPVAPLGDDAYADPALWFSRGLGSAQDSPRWRPTGAPNQEASMPAAVFFVHPTSHYDRMQWNASPDDATANKTADLFVRGLATPFNAAAELWVPRYRQATLGAFLTERPEGKLALDAAYADVLAAFDHFLAHTDPRLPIVLAGHSQGSFHLKRLMQERVAGKPLARRIAAAYVVGWPVSIEHDLPAIGLPACTKADQSGCILSWQSYAEPADTVQMLDAYAHFAGLDGSPRGTPPFLCTNPLTGGESDSASNFSNLGTLVPDAALSGGVLMPGLVPARCSPEGFLLIGPAPQMGPFVLPGNNYHVYDYPLFWSNVRADVARRVNHWHGTRMNKPSPSSTQASAAKVAPETTQPEKPKSWWHLWS
jgi:hypothetical protein